MGKFSKIPWETQFVMSVRHSSVDSTGSTWNASLEF